MAGDYREYEEPDERPRDKAIDAAAPRVLKIFEDSPTRVFYSTQIETQLEREFFHWITNKALLETANAGRIQRIPANVQGQTVNFYTNTRHRYWRREHQRLIDLLDRIFNPEFTQAIGRHAEMMFDSAMSRHGFTLTNARNVKSWNDRTWTETNHNLDRICVRDGIAYGVEIKNTQNYIQRDELLTKLRLCKFLGLTPLFIMRYAPKSYMHEVNQAGGFGLLFENQMYPWGHSSLLSEVRDRLGLKVDSPRDVKDGDMIRLVNWHKKKHGVR